MRISDWSSDVCSSDLLAHHRAVEQRLVLQVPQSPAGIVGIGPMLEHIVLQRHRLNRPFGHQLLGFCDRLGRAEAFWTGIGAVHDRVAAIETERILQCVKPLARHLIARSEEHTSELQSLMRSSYAVFCLTKKQLTHEHKYL